MKIAIINGHLIDPAQGIDGQQDLYIAEGKVAAIGQAPAGFVADQQIDAAGQVVCPGLVDMQAHLREPGQEHKGTIASETAAAVRGGITTLCCSPDTQPMIDTTAVVELINDRAQQAGKARVHPLGALTKGLKGVEISEMHSLKRAGCIGMSNAHYPIKNTLVLRRAMEYSATMDMPLFLHGVDPWLHNEGCAHEGTVSARLGLAGSPACAEEVEVAKILQLVELTGARVHFSQVSTAKAVQLIGRAQYEGLLVTADVAAHQLHLSHIDVAEFNSLCHVQPPLRTERDRDALREGVLRGAIGAICSDHQPHDADAKLAPFAETEPGISGLETLLPLALRMQDHGLKLKEVIATISTWPAGIMGLDVGALEPGKAADVCIFDPDAYWMLTPGEMASRGKNSPFINMEMKGRVSHTLVGGRLVYQLVD